MLLYAAELASEDVISALRSRMLREVETPLLGDAPNVSLHWEAQYFVQNKVASTTADVMAPANKLVTLPSAEAVASGAAFAEVTPAGQAKMADAVTLLASDAYAAQQPRTVRAPGATPPTTPFIEGPIGLLFYAFTMAHAEMLVVARRLLLQEARFMLLKEGVANDSRTFLRLFKSHALECALTLSLPPPGHSSLPHNAVRTVVGGVMEPEGTLAAVYGYDDVALKASRTRDALAALQRALEGRSSVA